MLAHVKENKIFTGIAVITVILYVATLIESKNVELFAFSPANTGLSHVYPWILITSCLLETNGLKLLVLLAILFKPCADLEQSGASLKKIILLVVAGNIVTNCIIFVFRILLFYTVNEQYLYKTNYGLMSIVMPILMVCSSSCKTFFAFKQFLYWQIPIPVGIIYTFFAFATSMSHDIENMWIGFFVTIVLSNKFLPKNPIVLSQFFPEKLRPTIEALNVVLGVLCRSKQNKAASRLESGPVTGAPFTPDPIADRRRARALKALDEKLALISKEPEVALDGDEEVDLA